MKVLLFGSKGQLGIEFEDYFIQNSISYIGFDIDTLDISNYLKVEECIISNKPDILINCTAYNNVELAEQDNKTALIVNAYAVENMAKLALKYNFKLIHFSSDYVFDGTSKIPYSEVDQTNPINEYGKSKLLGEQLIQNYSIDFVIFRLSWVFGKGKQNFIYKLNEWSKQNSNLKITSDEISIPTYTNTVVLMTLEAIKNNLKGVFHCTNSGYTSRYEYALIISELMNLDVSIEPIIYSKLNLNINRPLFSVMSNELIQEITGLQIPSWHYDLKKFIDTQFHF